MTEPWDWSKPVSEQNEQFAAAVAALPYWYFAPFTKDVATGLLYGEERPCLYWEKPTPSSPVFPPNPTYPNAPALVPMIEMPVILTATLPLLLKCDPLGPTRRANLAGCRFAARLVASLDRKRLEADFWGGAGCRTEAFSIRRLGGSRWRLRRTRCAMGFECQSGIESRDGGLAENSESGVEMVAAPWKRRNRKPTKKAVSVRRGHECVGVREHILASRLRDGLGRIEVHAC